MTSPAGWGPDDGPRGSSESFVSSLGNGSRASLVARRRARRRARIWIGVLLGVVAGNAVALGVYMVGFSTAPPEPTPPEPTDEAERDDALSRAYRLAGLEAMERGDFERAIGRFTEALRAPHPARDLPELLAVAHRLRDRARRDGESSSVGAEEPPRPVNRSPAFAAASEGEIGSSEPTSDAIRAARERAGPEEPLGSGASGGPSGGPTLDREASAVADEAVDEPDPTPEAAALPPAEPKSDRDRARDVALLMLGASAGSSGGANVASAPPVDVESRAPVSSGARSGPENGAETGEDAPLSPSVVRLVMQSSARRFRACYEQGLERRRGLAGSVDLSMRVDAEGRVRDTEVVSSTLNDRETEGCIKMATRLLQFPSRPGASSETVPFQLSFRPDG